jgi:L-rhamnose isomerase
MAGYRIDRSVVADHIRSREAEVADDYAQLGARLARWGIEIEGITAKVQAFTVAVPT